MAQFLPMGECMFRKARWKRVPLCLNRGFPSGGDVFGGAPHKSCHLIFGFVSIGSPS